MPVIDARPQGVELKAYAGDTFAFKIIVDYDYSAYTWTGHIRSNHTDQEIDTTFDFGTLTAVDGKWEIPVSLSAAKTQALADLVVESNVPAQIVIIGAVKSTKTSVQTYYGVWDIQVQLDDVVKTLVQGSILVDSDVTRNVV